MKTLISTQQDSFQTLDIQNCQVIEPKLITLCSCVTVARRDWYSGGSKRYVDMAGIWEQDRLKSPNGYYCMCTVKEKGKSEFVLRSGFSCLMYATSEELSTKSEQMEPVGRRSVGDSEGRKQEESKKGSGSSHLKLRRNFQTLSIVVIFSIRRKETQSNAMGK